MYVYTENPKQLRPSRGWANVVAKAYRRALHKVRRGEWLGVPRKLRREVWRALNGTLRDPRGRPCVLNDRTAESLLSMWEAADHGRRLR